MALGKGTDVKMPITAEDGATAVFNRVQAGLGKLDKSLLAARAGWAAVAVVVGSAVTAMARAGREGEQAGLRLNAVLRATGHSAGITRTEIGNLVDELAGVTQFDDEGIANAAAELLKFGNIHKQVFGDALKLTADFAAFTGKSVPDAAQAVGKALASPTEGMGMLEREIGKLHPAQEKLIKNLVESGRLMDAQGVVLDILRGKFGGTAQEINSGYLKAQEAVTKNWNDFLEATGRTSIIAVPVQGFLNKTAEGLERLKNVMESGTWWQKWLVLTGNPLSAAVVGATFEKPAAASPGRDERMKALEGAEAARLKEQAMGQAEQDDRVNKFLAERQKKANEEYLEREKRLRDEDIRGWVAHAEAVFAEADETNLALAKISDEHWAREERLREQDIRGWVDYAQQVFDKADEVNRALADIADAAEKDASKAARELGLTFSSAFEDAIVGGKELREILQGLAQDILRFAVRKTVTEPLAEAASGFLKGINWGSIFGGPKAAGGPVAGGTPYLVGERGPELFVPGASGSIVPNHAMGGGPVFNIDARGADVGAVQRLERVVRDLHGSFNRRAVAAVNESRLSGARV